MQMIQSCAERPFLIHITGDPDYSRFKIYRSVETFEKPQILKTSFILLYYYLFKKWHLFYKVSELFVTFFRYGHTLDFGPILNIN